MKKFLVALVFVFLALLVSTAFAEEKGAPIQSAQVTQPAPAPAEAPAKINTGDTAWVLTSSALVLLMTPGLALFYGGMVRRK
ncbi:MAG: ammonia channel protein, partial [Syntrophobacteraceae bacterium]